MDGGQRSTASGSVAQTEQLSEPTERRPAPQGDGEQGHGAQTEHGLDRGEPAEGAAGAQGDQHQLVAGGAAHGQEGQEATDHRPAAADQLLGVGAVGRPRRGGAGRPDHADQQRGGGEQGDVPPVGRHGAPEHRVRHDRGRDPDGHEGHGADDQGRGPPARAHPEQRPPGGGARLGAVVTATVPSGARGRGGGGHAWQRTPWGIAGHRSVGQDPGPRSGPLATVAGPWPTRTRTRPRPTTTAVGAARCRVGCGSCSSWWRWVPRWLRRGGSSVTPRCRRPPASPRPSATPSVSSQSVGDISIDLGTGTDGTAGLRDAAAGLRRLAAAEPPARIRDDLEQLAGAARRGRGRGRGHARRRSHRVRPGRRRRSTSGCGRLQASSDRVNAYTDRWCGAAINSPATTG